MRMRPKRPLKRYNLDTISENPTAERTREGTSMRRQLITGFLKILGEKRGRKSKSPTIIPAAVEKIPAVRQAEKSWGIGAGIL